jgi:DNA (cytosine-5)-methyltransferase 1
MNPFIYDMDLVRKESEKKLFSVVSLFAGGGGSSTGYRLAGGDVLAVNEFIESAQECYQSNYPETYIFKNDIRSLNGEDILNQIGLKKGELDILDGSPPCSSFSTAGKREKGWGEERSYSDSKQRTDDLFFEFARILNDVQPKVFVCENVKGITMGESSKLLGSEQMSFFDAPKTIYEALVDCGYKVRYKVLNARDYGVPQNRERTIFIGVRSDIHKKITFPLPFGYEVSVIDALFDVKNTQQDIDDATFSDGVVKSYLVQMKEGESGDKYAPNGYFGLQRVRRDRPCPTIVQRQGNKGACLSHWVEDRALSVPELKRLMSFPDDYYLGEKYAKKVERLGRAVPPLMMRAIAQHIYKSILQQ